MLKKFKMNGCKTISTLLVTNEKLKKEDGSRNADGTLYRSLIGSLLYLIVTQRNIMYATSLLSRIIHNPTHSDIWKVQ